MVLVRNCSVYNALVFVGIIIVLSGALPLFADPNIVTSYQGTSLIFTGSIQEGAGTKIYKRGQKFIGTLNSAYTDIFDVTFTSSVGVAGMKLYLVGTASCGDILFEANLFLTPGGTPYSISDSTSAASPLDNVITFDYVFSAPSSTVCRFRIKMLGGLDVTNCYLFYKAWGNTLSSVS